MNISSTFNVADLYEYYPPYALDSGNSRLSSFQVVETCIEQTAMAFLDSHACLKSTRKGLEVGIE